MDTNNENTITDTAPTATPTDAERNMSRPAAVAILMQMMKRRDMTPDDVDALALAVRDITRRHVQRQRNWARRRLAKAKDNAEG